MSYWRVISKSFLSLQGAVTLKKRVSARGWMYPMQTGQWVLMTLIGLWEVALLQVIGQDHQLIIPLEQLLVSSSCTVMLSLLSCVRNGKNHVLVETFWKLRVICRGFLKSFMLASGSSKKSRIFANLLVLMHLSYLVITAAGNKKWF